MNEILIINEKELANLWPITSFKEAYSQDSALSTCSVFTISDCGDPDKTVFLIFRCFIENGKRAKDKQKYVIGLKFYNFGSFATLDLISLDDQYHKRIASEHIKRMKWEFFDDQFGDDFDKTRQAPFLFAGGFLKIEAENLIKFSSTSLDYGNSVFFADSNEISQYLVSASGLKTLPLSEVNKGKNFLQIILEFMLEKKLTPDFYEKFTLKALQNFPEGARFTGQQISSLMIMKVVDRKINEGGDILKIFVDEISEGFGRSVLLNSVANRIKQSKET